jgi:hypothetical protein
LPKVRMSFCLVSNVMLLLTQYSHLTLYHSAGAAKVDLSYQENYPNIKKVYRKLKVA